MSVKKFYFDTETTGFDPEKNDIIELSAIIEVDNEVKESFTFFIQPRNWEHISPEALAVNGYKEEDLKNFTAPGDAYKALIEKLKAYVDQYDRNDKFIVVGYNVRFDMDMLRGFFNKCGDKYFGSWFYSNYFLDVYQMAMIARYMGKFRHWETMKLGDVAKALRIDLDNYDLHKGSDDIALTRRVFQKFIEMF